MNGKTCLAVVAAISACGVIGSSYAAMEKGNDALAITATKVTLTQAIAKAEKYIGGVASRAEYEHENGHDLFDVEVVKGGSVMDVAVDALTGQVIEAHADTADRGGDCDDEDEGGD